MLRAVFAGKGLVAEVARELRFADSAAAPQEPGDQAGGPDDPEAAGQARESGCDGDNMSLSGASDGRPLSDATRKVTFLGLAVQLPIRIMSSTKSFPVVEGLTI